MLTVPEDEDGSFFNGVEPFSVASLLYVIINDLTRPIATATGWKSVCHLYMETELLPCDEDTDKGFNFLKNLGKFGPVLLQTPAVPSLDQTHRAAHLWLPYWLWERICLFSIHHCTDVVEHQPWTIHSPSSWETCSSHGDQRKQISSQHLNQSRIWEKKLPLCLLHVTVTLARTPEVWDKIGLRQGRWLNKKQEQISTGSKKMSSGCYLYFPIFLDQSSSVLISITAILASLSTANIFQRCRRHGRNFISAFQPSDEFRHLIVDVFGTDVRV